MGASAVIRIKAKGGDVLIDGGRVVFPEGEAFIGKFFAEWFASDRATGAVGENEDHDLLLALRIQERTGGELDLSRHTPPDTDTTGGIVY